MLAPPCATGSSVITIVHCPVRICPLDLHCLEGTPWVRLPVDGPLSASPDREALPSELSGPGGHIMIVLSPGHVPSKQTARRGPRPRTHWQGPASLAALRARTTTKAPGGGRRARPGNHGEQGHQLAWRLGRGVAASGPGSVALCSRFRLPVRSYRPLLGLRELRALRKKLTEARIGADQVLTGQLAAPSLRFGCHFPPVRTTNHKSSDPPHDRIAWANRMSLERTQIHIARGRLYHGRPFSLLAGGGVRRRRASAPAKLATGDLACMGVELVPATRRVACACFHVPSHTACHVSRRMLHVRTLHAGRLLAAWSRRKSQSPAVPATGRPRALPKQRVPTKDNVLQQKCNILQQSPAVPCTGWPRDSPLSPASSCSR